MNEQEAVDVTSDDPAAIGFAMLMANVETAVADATLEISELGRVVQQGFGNLPGITPPPAIPSQPRLPKPEPDNDGLVPSRPTQPAPSTPEPVARPAEKAAAPSLAAGGSRPVQADPIPPADSSLAGRRTPPPFSHPTAGSASMPQIVPNSLSPLPTHTRMAPAPPAALDAAPSASGPALAPALVEMNFPFRSAGSHSFLSAPGATPSAAAVGGSAVAEGATPATPWLAATAMPTTPSPSWEAEPAHSLAPCQAAPISHVAVADSIAPTAALFPQPNDVKPNRLPDGRSDAPEPAPVATGGPIHGDVFLDGVRVGRWMSEILARAASRPAHGRTDHDPLMGPRWPGALQGH